MTYKNVLSTIAKLVVLFVTCVLFAISIFIAIQNYIVRTTNNYVYFHDKEGDIDNIPKCDAIMILGARVMNSGTPSYTLKMRLEYGYDLYIAGKADKIIVSGDHLAKEYDEVNAMKTYLMDKGVPSEDIFMDHAGVNTYDSMYRAKEIFEVKSMIISTQDFHIHRSIYLAQKLGIEAYGYPSEDAFPYKISYNVIRESFARVKAYLDVEILKRDPQYLGEKIPITGSGDLTNDY